MPDDVVERHLPDVTAIIGQTAMPAERLERARKLRAIVNVEGNFLPNVDYAAALDRGVHVLNASPAFALPVAEAALGMAIDLARGIAHADRAMRAGNETYGLESNADAFLFAGSPVGIVGFGDLGRELRRLIAPLRNPVKVHDPWLPDDLVRRHDAEPASLPEVLDQRVIFVFATSTADNEGFLGRAQLDRIRPGSVFVLMSRAGVVDFDALTDLVAAGPLPRRHRRVPRGAARARPSRAAARRHAALTPPRRRDARGVPGDRPARGGRPRADPRRPAAAALQARRARDGRPPAQPAGGEELTRTMVRGWPQTTSI